MLKGNIYVHVYFPHGACGGREEVVERREAGCGEEDLVSRGGRREEIERRPVERRSRGGPEEVDVDERRSSRGRREPRQVERSLRSNGFCDTCCLTPYVAKNVLPTQRCLLLFKQGTKRSTAQRQLSKLESIVLKTTSTRPTNDERKRWRNRRHVHETPQDLINKTN